MLRLGLFDEAQDDKNEEKQQPSNSSIVAKPRASGIRILPQSALVSGRLNQATLPTPPSMTLPTPTLPTTLPSLSLPTPASIDTQTSSLSHLFTLPSSRFGLGAFGDHFITDEDLEQARIKQDILDQQSAEEKRIAAIQQAIDSFLPYCEEVETAMMGNELNVTLACDYWIIGQGQCILQANGIHWHGLVLIQATSQRTRPLQCQFSYENFQQPPRVKVIERDENWITFKFQNLSMQLQGNRLFNESLVAQYQTWQQKKRQVSPLSEYRKAIKEIHEKRIKSIVEACLKAEEAEKIAKLRYEASLNTNKEKPSPVIVDTEKVVSEESTTCTLCYDEPVSIQLLPCQHSVCQSCWPHLNQKCPWDRLDVQANKIEFK